MRSYTVLTIALAAALMLPSPTLAHKVVASVWSDGDSIEGEVGFSNGDPAPAGTRIQVATSDGEILGEVVTDEAGLFRFTPTKAVGHAFKANLGSGHIADIVMEKEELPLTLIRSLRAQAPDAEDAATRGPQPAAQAPLAEWQIAELERLISEALRREINPLRRELTDYREKQNMQSVLGGLGYIFGLFGLLFFVYARRERASN